MYILATVQSNKYEKTILLFNLPNCYTISLSISLRNPLRMSLLIMQVCRPTPLDLALNLAFHLAAYTATYVYCLHGKLAADKSRSRS